MYGSILTGKTSKGSTATISLRNLYTGPSSWFGVSLLDLGVGLRSRSRSRRRTSSIAWRRTAFFPLSPSAKSINVKREPSSGFVSWTLISGFVVS